jgi:hypothetical protein
VKKSQLVTLEGPSHVWTTTNYRVYWNTNEEDFTIENVTLNLHFAFILDLNENV